MASIGRIGRNVSSLPRPDEYPPSSITFDFMSMVFAAWWLIGLFADGAAHAANAVDTFFTPWHLILYSGFLAVALWIGGLQLRNMYKGYTLWRALPRGYLLALVGIILFAIAAPLDFIWHDVFGFELRLDALLSPPHLMLISGAMLFGTAPLRTAWIRMQQGEKLAGWRGGLAPMVMSLFFLMVTTAFMTQYAHPLASPKWLSLPYVGAPEIEMYRADLWGIASAHISTFVLISILLLSLRFWPLPFGSITLLVGGSMFLLWAMRASRVMQYWPVLAWAVVIGLAADCAMHYWKIDRHNRLGIRLLCSLLPAGFFLGYYLIIMAGPGLTWITHMWTGMIFEVAIVGLILSFLVAPPYEAPSKAA